MRRTTSALAAAPDAHGSVAAGVGKISKTTPCKAASGGRSTKQLDTSGNSGIFFYYSEIAKVPPSLRGAIATKQSIAPHIRLDGLLRFARNDERYGPPRSLRSRAQ